MREGPILMSAPMIRATLADLKTQTRRIVKPRHPISHIGPRGTADDPAEWGYFFDGPYHNGYMVLGRGFDERHDHGRISIPCPYGQPGDRLWVRETFISYLQDDPERVVLYRADHQCVDGDGRLLPAGATSTACPCHDEDGPIPWRPSIHMPRWASRITLEVTGVRVERLQDISEEDARAEGVRAFEGGYFEDYTPGSNLPCICARESFETLWRSINGAESWDANPWVWRIEFRRVAP